MYLKRKIDSYLLEWKKSPQKKPLIVKGARQIGKTVAIRHFGATYKNFIEINFAEQPQFKTICENGYEVQSILNNISRINSSFRFEKGETLIFFDELQDFPEIATSLKFFNQDGRFDVICSGSLLGISYKKIESNSVGNKTDYIMQSMDFEEFLTAKGYGAELFSDLLSHMKSLEPFNQTTMNVMSKLFLDYCILGGMPEVVCSYIEKGTFEGTLDLQKSLVNDYKEDIRKYLDGLEQTRVLNVFNHIPVQLAKENKKFQISKVASGARFKDYWGCIEWLNDAGIINICRCLSFPELPLKGNYKDRCFKIYLHDTGLLVACLDASVPKAQTSIISTNANGGLVPTYDEAQEDLRANKNLGVYKGALYENFIAESLSKQGAELFYYKREDSTLEQDFFMRTKKSLVPLEVKSENGRAKSMRTLIASEKYPDITTGIKLCNANIGFANNVYKFPYFCTFLLKEYLRDVEF